MKKCQCPVWKEPLEKEAEPKWRWTELGAKVIEFIKLPHVTVSFYDML